MQDLNVNFPNIERMTLPQLAPYERQDFHNSIENEIGDAQFEAISKFKKVKHLGVGYQPHMSSQAFKMIAGMENLESISFNNMTLKKEDLDKLLKMPKLQELSLGKCEYDEEWIRQKTNLLPVNGVWVGPKHPDYKKAKKEEEERLAEVKRIESLTGKDWKEKFHEAMAEGRKKDAFEILKLNHVFDKRIEKQNFSNGRNTSDIVGCHVLLRRGLNEMTVRND